MQTEKIKKVMVPVLSAFLGALAVFGFLAWNGSKDPAVAHSGSKNPKAKFVQEEDASPESDFDSFFADEEGVEMDSTGQMASMRKMMEVQMQKLAQGRMGDPWKSGGVASASKISEREDENFVYFDIQAKNLNPSSINTNIENGYLSITGTIEKKSGDDEQSAGAGMQSYFKSTFNQTFPLSIKVDPEKMEMTHENGKIVLKFPKRKDSV